MMDRSLISELRARGYNQGRIFDAVRDVQHVFPTLRPAIGSAPVTHQEYVKLFVLTGTIHLPSKTPLAVVKCPPKTLINPGSILDRNGRISHPYLDNWTEAGSSLGDFVQIIASDFAGKLPYFSLENYKLPSKVKENIENLLKDSPSYTLDQKHLIEGSGPSDEMILASGTINTVQLGVKDTHCVDIWLHEDFPLRAPLVYVYPRKRRWIESGTPEYRRARVDLPYLHDWVSGDHCLQVLAHVLIIYCKERQTGKAPWLPPNVEPHFDDTQFKMEAVHTDTTTHKNSPSDSDSQRPEQPSPSDNLSSSTVKVSGDLRTFASECKLSDSTLQRIAKAGFCDLRLVLVLTEPDLKDLGLCNLAEVVKLREGIKKYRTLQCTPETKSDTNVPCGAACPPPAKR